MDLFSKAFSILNALIGALTLPGLLVVCAVGLIASAWALMNPRGRMIFFVLAVLCYALSMGSGDDKTSRVPIPGIVVTMAYALKWILIIPLIIYGFTASIVGRGASILTTAAFFLICFYIFSRAFMSGSWDRYFLWILMMIGLPGVGAQLCRELGVSAIFRYMFFLAYFLLIIAALQLVTKPGSAWMSYRYTGFLPNPNSMGAFLGCLIVPGLWVFFERSRTKLVLVILIVLGIMLMATGSRASACQILPVAALICIFYSKKPAMWVAFLIVAAVVMIASLFFFSDALMSRFTSTSTSGRMDLWREYWQIGMENPVFGKGMGWILNYSEISMGPHNGFVFIFVESGMIGLVLITIAFLFVIFNNKGRKYYYLFPEQRRMRWFVVAQLIGFLISGFFESWFIGVGYFELLLFLFTVGMKDELDNQVYAYGQEYWDKSLFITPVYSMAEPQQA